MTNILFKPDYRNVQNDLQRVMGELFHKPVQDIIHEKKVNVSPAFANIVEKTESFMIQIAIPGFTKSEVDIHLDGDRLKVSGKRELGSGEIKYQRREFDMPSFERIFFLPENIQKDKIEATVINGILQITLLKAEKAVPVSIEVR
ncbi:MAG: Hsp20/alpha crystallin family protein [Saprospiraceae bacterium]|nr:Hsp20/alpha crystallin family protein [Saprospiraceae bacterium]